LLVIEKDKIMESSEIVIKKASMIKKNLHDINEVYSLEKGVIDIYYNLKLLETWKWIIWGSTQSNS